MGLRHKDLKKGNNTRARKRDWDREERLEGRVWDGKGTRTERRVEEEVLYSIYIGTGMGERKNK